MSTASTWKKDAALERRFQPIMVEEPTVEETVQILMGLGIAMKPITGEDHR